MSRKQTEQSHGFWKRRIVVVVGYPAPNNHFACPFYASLTALAKFPGVAVRQPPSFLVISPIASTREAAIVSGIVPVFFGMCCHGVSAIKHCCCGINDSVEASFVCRPCSPTRDTSDFRCCDFLPTLRATSRKSASSFREEPCAFSKFTCSPKRPANAATFASALR